MCRERGKLGEGALKPPTVQAEGEEGEGRAQRRQRDLAVNVRQSSVLTLAPAHAPGCEVHTALSRPARANGHCRSTWAILGQAGGT